MPRVYVRGGSAPTTLSADISGSSLAITAEDLSTWGDPTGVGKIHATIGRGTPKEEDVWVTSISGNVANIASVGDRGIENTSPIAHDAGESFEVTIGATLVDEANDHIHTTSRDDHLQYHNNARHDLTARHTLGTVVPTSGSVPATIVPGSGTAGAANAAARHDHEHPIATAAGASIGDANATGVSSSFSRADHNHLLKNGVVGPAQIQTAAVQTTKVADGAITRVKMASNMDITVGDVVRGFAADSNDIPNTSTYETVRSTSITLESRCVVAITVALNVRSGSPTGNYDYRVRVQVGGVDHPRLSTYGEIDGWLENEGTRYPHFTTKTIFWPLDSGTHNIVCEMLVASGSAGDMNVRDAKIEAIELNYG